MIFKKWFRHFVSNGIAIVGTSYLVTGFQVEKEIRIVAIAAIALSLVNLILKPILKVISFPINIATLGFFSLVINAIILYITIYFVGGLKITGGIFSFNLPELGLVIPEIQLTWLWTLFLASVVISVINWILKKLLF